MNEPSPNSKLLTLFIPTRNRPAHLRRLVSYLAYQRCPHPLIVADSSDDAPAGEVRSVIADFRDTLNLDFSQHRSDLPPLEKLNLALDRVQSPLCAMLADDDFYLPGALVSAADFLTTNPDYSAVLGHSLGFVQSESGIGAKKRIQWSDYPQRSIEQPEIAGRLMENFEGYTTNWYSVQRTAEQRAIMNRALVFQDDVYLLELFVSACLVAQGRVKRLNSLFLLREGTVKKEYVRTSVYAAITSVWHSAQHQLFVEQLAAFLTETGGIPMPTARELAEEALLRYAGSQLTRTRVRTREFFRHPFRHTLRYLSILSAYHALPSVASGPDGHPHTGANADQYEGDPEFAAIRTAIAQGGYSR